MSGLRERAATGSAKELVYRWLEQHIAELPRDGGTFLTESEVAEAAGTSRTQVVEVGSGTTSGEVEPVVVRHGGRYFLGVGSDHTDRELERNDIAGSKAACPKPLGNVVTDAGTDLSEVDCGRISVDVPSAGDLALYCGALPLLGGEFVYGSDWRIHQELPGGLALAHAYKTKTRRL